MKDSHIFHLDRLILKINIYKNFTTLKHLLQICNLIDFINRIERQC